MEVSPTLIPLSGFAAFVGAVLYWKLVQLGSVPGPALLRRSLPIPPPTRIISLYIYPIKSCRGIQVNETRILKSGLDLDRRWMFVDATTRKFKTIRDLSKMTLIATSISPNDELIIGIKDTPTRVIIPAHPSREWLEANTRLAKGEIWRAEIDGWEYREEISAPFSELFGQGVRLLYKGPTPRWGRGSGRPDLLGREQEISFPDMLQILVANQKSLDELNLRVKKNGGPDLTIERFRPNIIVEGEKAWYEDIWKTIKISPSEHEKELGDTIELDVPSRCLRCQVPNVHPNTGVKHSAEPWKTLNAYRVIDRGFKRPVFGMLCVPRSEGLIKVGMRLDVIQVTGDHVYVRG